MGVLIGFGLVPFMLIVDKSGQDSLSSQTHSRNVLSDHQIPKREGKEPSSADDQMSMIYETDVARRWSDSVEAKPKSGSD